MKSFEGHAHTLEIHSDIETPILSDQNKYSTYTEAPKKSTNRLSSFDIFRGIIMIIMLIDHYDDVITTTQRSESWYGIQPGYYVTFNGNLSLALYKFILRFASSICAPGFVILMGFSLVHYYHHRLDKLRWSKLQIVKYLFLRGILLLILDYFIMFTIIVPWFCDYSVEHPCTDFVYPADVLYFLGTNLILLIPILVIENYLYQKHYFCLSYLLLITIILFSIISTQIITPKYYEYGTVKISDAQSLLYTAELEIFRYWPMIPWTSFAVTGVILGRIVYIVKKNYQHKMPQLYMIIFYIGFIMLIAFAIIRYIGSLDFGNFGYKWYDKELIGGPWIGIQFFLTTKYPPSVCFFLLWAGCILVILSLIYYICDYNNYQNKHGKLYHIILVYGNTALFFYVIHLIPQIYLGYLLENRWYVVKYDRISWWINVISMIVSLLMLTILYPVCSWYKRFKRRKQHTSYWKLF